MLRGILHHQLTTEPGRSSGLCGVMCRAPACTGTPGPLAKRNLSSSKDLGFDRCPDFDGSPVGGVGSRRPREAPVTGKRLPSPLYAGSING